MKKVTADASGSHEFDGRQLTIVLLSIVASSLLALIVFKWIPERSIGLLLLLLVIGAFIGAAPAVNRRRKKAPLSSQRAE